MERRTPLSVAEREQVYRDKLRGRTFSEIAADLACSIETVRKWWRKAQHVGRQGLQSTRYGRPPTGLLSRFSPSIITSALRLKRQNPRWGPDRVLVELRRDPALASLALPSRSRLALLFKAECPECLEPRRPKRSTRVSPARPTAVHECWQLDMQEGIRLDDGTIATVCSIRDPVGAAIVLSRAFDVTTPKGYRKLHWEDIRLVIRSAATRWGTLPDALQTDNEVCLGGQPADPAPSRLTLWLQGLGVAHRFIRPGRPTDQAQIERTHRTLDTFTGMLDGVANLERLQARLDAEVDCYNTVFPSRASKCHGQPPVIAYPELLRPRRAYKPEQERALFNEQRVYDYLGSIALERKVSSVGQIQVGRRLMSVGRSYAGQTVRVECAPARREWVVRSGDGQEVARHPVQGLDAATLTGLPDQPAEPALPPVQHTLPCLVP